MKVYVAGSTKEIPRVLRVVNLLAEYGAKPTLAWWEDVGQVGKDNPKDQTTREDCAWRDLQAVRESNAVVVLVPGPNVCSPGAFTEMGFALAAPRPVYSSGLTDRSIFCALTKEFASDENLVHTLAEDFGLSEIPF